MQLWLGHLVSRLLINHGLFDITTFLEEGCNLVHVHVSGLQAFTAD